MGSLQLAAILVDIAKNVLTQTHFTNVDNTLVMINSSKMHQQMEN